MNLILLALLSVAPPKASRCQATFDAMDAALGIRKTAFTEMQKKYADAGESITRKFLERCAALTDDEIDCPLTKKGNEVVKACPPAMDAFQKSMAAFIEEKDPGSFERFQLASMRTEAKANLKAISTGLKMLHVEATAPATFAFPASVARTPKVDCCSLPDRVCRADATTFTHPTWNAIGWVTEGKLRYGYEVTSKGKGPTAGFVIRASGDPQCKGKPEVWQVTGSIQKGELVVSDPALAP